MNHSLPAPPSSTDTWPDFFLPTSYRLDLEGLTEVEKAAALTAIEEIIRPLRGPKKTTDDPESILE